MATPTTTAIVCAITDIDFVGGGDPGVSVTFSYVNMDGAAAAGSTSCTSTRGMSEVDLKNDLKQQMAAAINADQAVYTCQAVDILIIGSAGAP